MERIQPLIGLLDEEAVNDSHSSGDLITRSVSVKSAIIRAASGSSSDINFMASGLW
jgi:hypothetical protein